MKPKILYFKLWLLPSTPGVAVTKAKISKIFLFLTGILWHIGEKYRKQLNNNVKRSKFKFSTIFFHVFSQNDALFSFNNKKSKKLMVTCLKLSSESKNLHPSDLNILGAKNWIVLTKTLTVYSVRGTIFSGNFKQMRQYSSLWKISKCSVRKSTFRS